MRDLLIAVLLTVLLLGVTLTVLWKVPEVYDMRDFPVTDLETELE